MCGSGAGGGFIDNWALLQCGDLPISSKGLQTSISVTIFGHRSFDILREESSNFLMRNIYVVVSILVAQRKEAVGVHSQEISMSFFCFNGGILPPFPLVPVWSVKLSPPAWLEQDSHGVIGERELEV